MNKQKKIIIYTAIFGGRDRITEPVYLPANADFVCFTDSDIKSDAWEVRKVEPVSESSVRAAKIYKVLPHKYFPDYEYSIWIDGNILVHGDINELINEYLKDVNFAAYDHMKCEDKRDCIYDEAQALQEAAERGRHKNLNFEKLEKQIQRYKEEGYPANNGLIHSAIMLRRHNEPDVIKTMDDWWKEIVNNSRRDQLSFNYVAWKNNFKFVYLPGDSRNNKYFKMVAHAIRGSMFLKLLVRCERFFKKITSF
ncbi:glycosyltransferase domain-containing protein [Patescibacteria group bacterium]